jgi:hypothetical protein
MLSNKYIKNKTIKIWGATPGATSDFFFLINGQNNVVLGWVGVVVLDKFGIFTKFKGINVF